MKLTRDAHDELFLAEVLKIVGPSVSAMGVSVQDTNNELVLTALDAMCRSLSDTTPQAQKALDDLGIVVYEY